MAKLDSYTVEHYLETRKVLFFSPPWSIIQPRGLFSVYTVEIITNMVTLVTSKFLLGNLYALKCDYQTGISFYICIYMYVYNIY